MKSFNKASRYIFIDDKVRTRGLTWLASHVNTDGSVRRVGYVHDSSLQVSVDWYQSLEINDCIILSNEYQYMCVHSKMCLHYTISKYEPIRVI